MKAVSATEAEALIELLEESKISVRVEDGELVIKAPRGVLTPAMMASLKLHKQALLSWAAVIPLGQPAAPPPRITPEMLPLVRLEPAQIDRIVEATPGGAANIQDIYPLAPLQEGILFHHLLQQKGDAYLTRLLMDFDSKELLDRFVAAMDQVIARQDVLRTAVHWDGLAEPVQVVWRQARLDVEVMAFDSGESSIQLQAQLQAHADPRRFRLDVRQAPLMKGFAAFDPDGQRWLLQLLYHHLALDHISLELLVQEVVLILQDRQAELPQPVPFSNFVAQARLGTSAAEHEAFFRQMLGDVDQPTAPFDLLDVQGNGANAVQSKLPVPDALAGRLRRLARSRGVSPASIFHLAWAQVLAACTGRDDVVFGTVLFGRMQGGAGADRAMGMFINTLPLRVRLGELGAEQSLKQVNGALIELLHHEHASLTLAQRCSAMPPNTPLFSALLNYRYSRPENAGGGAVIDGIRYLESRDRTNYPFVLHVDDLGQGFTLTAEIVDTISAERICGFVQTVLEGLVHALENAPQTPMHAIEVLPASERDQVLHGLNNSACEPGGANLVHVLFEQQAARSPDAVAVEYEQQRLSYRQLNQQANQLAHHLRGIGVGPDDRVAICLERGPLMVIAILATLKSGGAYVPLDPAYPGERLAHMLGDSAPLALLTQENFGARIETPPAAIRLVLDQAAWEQSAWGQASTSDPSPELITLQTSHLAYVIYTSGSTGQPKGVAMPHRGLVNLLNWQRGILPQAARTLQFAALGFDVAFQEIFSTLAGGGTLVLLNESLRQDLPALASWISSQAIERLFLPYIALNSLSELWSQQAAPLPALQDLITAGEQLRITPAIRRLFEHDGGARLHNHYGPTESHVVSAQVLAAPSTSWEDLPPIGRPLDNCRIYLLDAHLRPVPLGVAGEIYIGGVQVARGYLQQPGLTAERFIDDPFAAGERLYKSGDLGRWRDDGSIAYLGRNDFQVKIRGFRIELGEIEAQLSRLAGVREAAVIAREDATGDKRLIAYVVGDQETAGLDPAALRAQLGEKLPEYMLPLAFVTLQALPLTPNGKLDRNALPAPEGQAFIHRTYEATIGDIEQTLAEIWSDLLGVERVGRHDNFFELGGHSLLAVRLISQLRERLGIELQLTALFTHPQLDELAHEVAEAGQNTLSAIARADRSAPLPLSFAQQRLWFIARVDPEASKAYHIPDAVRLRGVLDKAALQAALDRIVERHEVLRTRFVGIGGQARQVIDEAHGFTLVQQELGGASDAELEQICRQEAGLPFDLALGPLIRGRLLRLGADDHVLLVTMHHIISDGWSGGVLAREFSALYEAMRAGQPDPLPPLAIQYADYGVWQRQWLQGPLLQQQLQQWVQQLRGAPGLLDLPTDRPRPAIQDYRGANIEIALDSRLSRDLKALSQRHGTTLYMTMLAAWATVLARLSGQEQVVIGSSHAGRNRVEVEALIGFFVNTQALKVDLAGRPSVQALLAQVRQTAVQAQSLQDVPFERLVEALNPLRSMAHHPVFQVMLSWHNTPKVAFELPQLTVENVGGAPDSAQFELSLELREDGEQICGQLNYATALFDEATIRRHWGYLQAVLLGMVEDESQAVDQIDLLGEAERSLVLDTFNRAFNTVHREPRQDMLVHAMFEQQAAAQPDAVALEFQGERLSYRELNQRANQLAHHLRRFGVGPDQRVAICVERSLELVVALLATLKAGGAYVPLDPVYPDERLAHMLHDSASVALLTQEKLRSRFELTEGCACLTLDATPWENSPWGAAPVNNPDAGEAGLSGSHLAYLIYTSGSTGMPKGVMIEHRNLLNFLHGMEQNIHGLQPDCRRIAWNSSFGFDMAVKAWGQLAWGRTLYLVPEATRLNAEELLAFLEQHDIEAMECTPSHLRTMQAAGFLTGRAPTLRKLLLGGEAIDSATWAALAAVDDVLFFNMYGPTECSVDASCGLVDGRRPHIGHVMPGARIYLLDRERQPVPLGCVGEIYIGGAGVARGYLERPELTAERFLHDPFAAEANGRMYQTGDLGRWREDGSIAYLGRNDFQVKLRGFRIELGEIEAQLLQTAGVREAVVIAREDSPGDKRLVAYFVAVQDAAAPDPVRLRALLGEKLPEYMLPVAFVPLPALPLTPNGKLDRKALPAPDGQGLAQQAYTEPQGEIEQMIATLWSELLGVERIGRHDNFFDLGGYSLMIFQVIEGLKQKGFEVALQDILLAQELSTLAQLITVNRKQLGKQENEQWINIRKGGSRRPLIFIHEPSGEVLSYERLTRHIDEEIGIYGIRADRNAVSADSSNEALAASYVALIRQAQPDGPYRLAGWSAGGVLAYEVARQLLEQGQGVEFLGLIDSWHRGVADRGISELGLSDKQMLLVAFIEYFGYKLADDEVAQILASTDLASAIACARDNRWLKKEMSSGEFEARAELWFNLRAAAHRYYAQPLDVAAHLFTAHPPESSDPANGWSAVLRGRLQVHPIGGDHWSIMMDPARAGRVGSAISSILAGIDRAAKPAEPALHASAVAIRTGSAKTRKVFCIPGAGANATSFLDLCAGFAGDASFIGLEAAGFLGLEGMPPSVQEAAQRYVEAIRSMQPAGPYHLLGHSFGGWIALEIARQLIEAGAVVAPVVLVDTQAPRVHGHAGRDQAMHEYVKLMDLNIAAGLGVSAADLASRDRPSQVLLVFEKMKQARVLPARARLEDFEPVIEMFCRQCGIGYQAQQPFGGLPLLFCAAQADEDEGLDLDAWRRLEPGLRALHVDGSDHLSILKPPHVARLVEEIGKHWYLG
ncbi:amino acid adenylation domain protein [Collimonas fungivorans]|uniref:Amino acid adenylation domain protein n=1 Tax=Collimonas fungivorans TaxID=158899 RepID=A0A127PCS3_9BURK|nr:non-ribosomal peptide synthetase [Collimonas fungivorans]AMO95404.1 amino acid adenylation domain protein [Collimonas fungivorans]